MMSPKLSMHKVLGLALALATSLVVSGGLTAGLASADPVTVESKIVRIAKGEIGVGEPTKCNKYWWYGHKPAGCGDDTNGPWCAAFAGWVWDQASAPAVPKSYAVAGWTSWAKDHDQWKSRGPKPGDAAVYGTHHIGIVVAVHSATNIETVEGNSGSGPNNKVVHKTRVNPSNVGITGFIKPRK
jgi:hypothetical protein